MIVIRMNGRLYEVCENERNRLEWFKEHEPLEYERLVNEYMTRAEFVPAEFNTRTYIHQAIDVEALASLRGYVLDPLRHAIGRKL